MMYTKENDTFRTFQIKRDETDHTKYNMNDYSHMPFFEVALKSKFFVETNINDFDIFEDEPENQLGVTNQSSK